MLFLSEEKFFWKLFDGLKHHPGLADFRFRLADLLDFKANSNKREEFLEKWKPTALDICINWIDQAKFLREADLDSNGYFKVNEKKVEEFLGGLNNKFYFLNFKGLLSSAKVILEDYRIDLMLAERKSEFGKIPEWPPLVLLKHEIDFKLDFNQPFDFPDLDERTKAQIILAQKILENCPVKTKAISQLSVLPEEGKLLLVNSQQTLPINPDGLSLTPTTEFKLNKPGIIVELPGVKPFGYPQPEVHIQAPSTYFKGDLKTVWQSLSKGKDDWNEISPELKLLAWQLARRLKEGSSPKQQPLKQEPAQARVSPAVTNDARKKVTSPPKDSPSVPVAPQPSPMNSLPNAIQELRPEQFQLKNHLNKLLAMADQGGTVIKSLLPNALHSLVAASRESGDNFAPLEKTWKALSDFLTSKGIALLPATPSLEPIDPNQWKPGSDKEVRLRFIDQVPKGFFLLKRIGFTDSEETKKPVYLQSQGPYPTGLKEALTVLQGDPVGDQVINALEKLADGAGGEYQLEQDSINLFKNLYCGLLGKELRNSNQALFKSMMEKFENYLMRTFQIKPFDPQKNKVDDNFIEITGSKNVVRGVIRRVVCPGLWDTERRMRLPALVEMD